MAKSDANRSKGKGGAPTPGRTSRKEQMKESVAAEQAREAAESRAAEDAQASIRETMVDIGRGNQQAGRGREGRQS